MLKFGLCELTNRYNIVVSILVCWYVKLLFMNRYDQVHVLLCDIRTEEWVKGLPAAVTAK